MRIISLTAMIIVAGAFFLSAEAEQNYDQRWPSKYNQEGDDAIMGEASERPDQPVGYGTITESITPDPVVVQGAPDDEPVADETVVEPGLQSSPLDDDTPRSFGLRDPAGPDNTLRESPMDDSGIQENASPYAPTADLFTPERKDGCQP